MIETCHYFGGTMPDISAPTPEQLASAKEARGENELILEHNYDVIVSDLAGNGEPEEEQASEEDEPLPVFNLTTKEE